MESGDRPARSLQFTVGASREDNYRPVIAILETRGHDTDHALMPLFTVNTERESARGFLRNSLLDVGERLVLHRCFDLPAVAIEPVELARERFRFPLGFREQAANAKRHVRQSPRSVQPRPGHEAEIARRDPRNLPAGHREECDHTRLRLSSPYSSEALFY